MACRRLWKRQRLSRRLVCSGGLARTRWQGRVTSCAASRHTSGGLTDAARSRQGQRQPKTGRIEPQRAPSAHRNRAPRACTHSAMGSRARGRARLLLPPKSAATGGRRSMIPPYRCASSRNAKPGGRFSLERGEFSPGGILRVLLPSPKGPRPTGRGATGIRRRPKPLALRPRKSACFSSGRKSREKGIQGPPATSWRGFLSSEPAGRRNSSGRGGGGRRGWRPALSCVNDL